jgi:hypothetical protein
MSDFRGLAKLRLPPELCFHIRNAVNSVHLVAELLPDQESADHFQQLLSQPLVEMKKRLDKPVELNPRRHHPSCAVITETPSGSCTCRSVQLVINEIAVVDLVIES